MPRSVSPAAPSGSSTHRNPSSTRATSKATAKQAKLAKQSELENFALLYFKYTKLFEDHAAAMRHDPRELNAAHARVTAENNREQMGNVPNGSRSPAQIQTDLHALAKRCEMTPRNFDDRVRICFAAIQYVRTMMDCVLNALDRPRSDSETVIAIGSRLVREDVARQLSQVPNSIQGFPDPNSTQDFPDPNSTQGFPDPNSTYFCPTPNSSLLSAAPVFAHPIAKLTPSHPITRPIEDKEIALWSTNPAHVVGKAFVTTDSLLRRVFIVLDFAVKLVRGAQYDVVYEDTGLDDVLTVDPDTLFGIMADGAELITNM